MTKPEDIAIGELSIWFKNFGGSVLQNKTNDYGNPVFSIKGNSAEKTDIILIIPLPKKYAIYDFLGKKYLTVAIEIKPGETTKQLGITECKLIPYWMKYLNGETIYLDENKTPIHIDFFCLATKYSPNGFLFSRDTIRNSGQGHYNSYLNNQNPKIEYGDGYGTFRKSIIEVIKTQGCYKTYADKVTGIGVVLSSILDEDDTKRIGFLVMRNHPLYNGKSHTKWWHEWIKI